MSTADKNLIPSLAAQDCESCAGLVSADLDPTQVPGMNGDGDDVPEIARTAGGD